MIGKVHQRHPTVPVVFRLPNCPDFTIEFVVDTGFEGDLTLPAAAVTALGLPFDQIIVANLADNAGRQIDAHQAVIVWHGIEQKAQVLAMGRRPLLGTRLLDGNKLAIEFADGLGDQIDPL